jgi:hypothetical protein
MSEVAHAVGTAETPSISWKILVAGLIASMVMAMWEMAVEAMIPGGAGFWAAPVMIAATVLRDLQNVATPVPFDMMGVPLGMMGHMMNSVVLGIVFALVIAPRIPSLIGQIIVGMVYGVVIFAVMWFFLLPIIDPVMLKLNLMVFLAAHAMWGGALGWINHAVNK